MATKSDLDVGLLALFDDIAVPSSFATVTRLARNGLISPGDDDASSVVFYFSAQTERYTH